MYRGCSTRQRKKRKQHRQKKKKGSNLLGGFWSTGRLPEPSVQFEPFTTDISYPDRSSDVFALFGKSNIVCSDSVGYSSIYNTEERCLLGLPTLNSPKGPKHITVCIPRTEAHARSDFEMSPNVDSDLFTNTPHGDHMYSLYIMDMDLYNQCSFEVLVYYPVRRWCWRQLPPPPFFGDPKYSPCDNPPFALVDGTKICVSSEAASYYFDTVACQWSKAGDWVLPFRAKAEYIPEFGLWLGLSAQKPYNLCSVDLSGVTIGSCDTQPLTQYVGQDVDLPWNCSLKNAALVNMGSGRFCTAKFLDHIHDHDNCQMMILTGVELDSDDRNGEGAFRITKHKSECLASDSIVCVL
ncbi:unnamed protein product [Urochloa humidicola]